MTDETGLRIVLNDLYMSSGLILTDDFWHHVCVTYNATQGEVGLYVNNTLEWSRGGVSPDGKHFSATGSYITTYQEQDCVRGCYQDYQRFQGYQSHQYCYSRALTSAEVTDLYETSLNLGSTIPEGYVFNYLDVFMHTMDSGMYTVDNHERGGFPAEKAFESATSTMVNVYVDGIEIAVDQLTRPGPEHRGSAQVLQYYFATSSEMVNVQLTGSSSDSSGLS